MKFKSQRSRVGNGPWQCSSPDRIDNVRARSKVGNVPLRSGNVPAVRRFSPAPSTQLRKVDSTIVPPVMASSSDASKRVANIARNLSSQVSSGVLNEGEKEGIESKCVYCHLLIE